MLSYLIDTAQGFPEWLYQCPFPNEQGLGTIAASLRLFEILVYLTLAVLVVLST